MKDYVPTDPATAAATDNTAAMMSAEPVGALPVAGHHPFHKVVHNSRLVCWTTMAMAPVSAFIGVCMMILAGQELFPLKQLGFFGILGAVQWGFGGFSFILMMHPVWIWGRTMLYKKAILDDNGVDFHLGTLKAPEQVFIPWNEITSIQQGRAYPNNRQITVNGTDGAYATFTALTFFRPRHLAKLISKRSGVPITKV